MGRLLFCGGVRERKGIEANGSMLSQCISVICVLGIVVVALLVMVQAITLEHAACAVGRTCLLPILVFGMLCLVKTLLVPTIMAGLAMAQRIVIWFVGFVLVVLFGMIIIRWLFSKLNRLLPKRGNRRGEP
jgi:hypothetical protein